MDLNSIISISISLLITAGLSLIVTTVLAKPSMWMAEKLGAIDYPGERHVHSSPTPRMGGIAIFLGTMLSLALVVILADADIASALVTLPSHYDMPLLAIGLALMFAVGCVDDVVHLTALQKLLGQVSSAVVIVLSGVLLTDIHSATVGVYLSFGIWAYPITVFYLIAFANVINLIDGLDGLAAGVAAISGMAYFVLSCQTHIWGTAAMAAAVVASCLAFLRYNFHPAKLFMGDSGSLFLGMMLGTISLMGTMRISSITSLAVPVIIAAVPVMDTFAAIVRRVRRHVSIGIGDAGHIHHSLMELGFSQTEVVLTIYLLCAIFAATGVLISGSRLVVRLALVAFDLVIAAIVAERLNLFDKVLVRYYPNGRPRYLRGRAYASSDSRDGGKLNVLILCEHFRPSVDACAKRMGCICDALEGAGHDVYVLASETSMLDDPSYVLPPNVHLYPTYAMQKKTVINRLRNNWSEMVGSVRMATALGEFDVVICTSPPLLLALSGIRIAQRTHARLVFDVRDVWPDVAYEMGSFGEGSLYGRVFQWVADRAYNAAWMVTTVSPGKVRKLMRHVQPEKRDIVRLVPNGIDLAWLEQPEDGKVVERYRLDADPPCVYVGNLGLAQGLSSLLEIAKSRPDVRFLLFGSGAEERLLADKVETEGLSNVELCGRVSQQAAHTLLLHARCAYVPLKNSRMTDSVPTKLYEALGCGCPVLLAAAGDAVAILDDCGLGVAVPPEDVAQQVARFSEVYDRCWTEDERRASKDVISSRYSRQAASRELVAMLEREIRPEMAGTEESDETSQLASEA